MIYTMLLGLVMALPAKPVLPRPAAVTPDTLTCTVTAGTTAKRRCVVPIPGNREVVACSTADRKARRCASGWGTARTAWVTETRGAQCKISAKHTDWKSKVTVRMSKKSAKQRGASCALHVVVR